MVSPGWHYFLARRETQNGWHYFRDGPLYKFQVSNTRTLQKKVLLIDCSVRNLNGSQGRSVAFPSLWFSWKRRWMSFAKHNFGISRVSFGCYYQPHATFSFLGSCVMFTLYCPGCHNYLKHLWSSMMCGTIQSHLPQKIRGHSGFSERM